MSSPGYSMDQMYDALRKADAAGDDEGAKALAAAIAAQGGQPGTALQGPTAVPQNQSILRLPAMAGSALLAGTDSLADMAFTPSNALAAVAPQDPRVAALQKAKTQPGFWGNVLGLPDMNDPATVAAYKAMPEGYTGGIPMAPGTQPMNQLTDWLGLTHRKDLVPSTPLEKYGTAGVEAVPAIASSVMTGGGTIPSILTGEAGAMAGQAGHDLAPDSPWAPVAAGLGAGLLTGGLSDGVINHLNGKAAAKALSAAADALEEAKEAAFQGRSELPQAAAQVKKASAQDFATTKAQIQSDLEASHGQADQTISALAGSLGDSTTLQQAGEKLQGAARGWITGVLPSKLAAAWQPVDEAISAEAPVNLSAFRGALKEINSSSGMLEPAAALVKPGLPAQLESSLKSIDAATELKGGTPGEYPWAAVRQFRTTLGEAMSDPKVITSLGAKNVSKLYATLTADMGRTAEEQGAGDLFSQANQKSTELYKIGEGPMARLVAGARPSADDPAPEAVAKSLLTGGKAGATDLATLRNEIPSAVDELAAAHLKTNPKAWSGLSPEAKSALLPEQAHAALVDGTLLAKEQAAQSAAQGIKLAQQNHQANVASAQEALRAGSFANAQAVRNSSKAYAAAKAAVPERGSPGGHSLGALAGLGIGGEAGIIGLNMLGFPGSDIMHGAMGSALALGLPLVRSGLSSVAKNPRVLRAPALGALTGSNALTGPSEQSQ